MTDKEKLDAIRAEIRRLVDVRGYGKGMANDLFTFMDSLPNEPVNKDFELALAEMIDKAQKCVVEPWVVAAQWKDELIKLAKSEEPVSEELEEAAEDYAATGEILPNGKEMISFDALKAFKAGAKWKEKQMMAKAVDATVHIEAGNYPYIPQIELYDYDKDVPLAKEGDKYKVVLIKENGLCIKEK